MYAWDLEEGFAMVILIRKENKHLKEATESKIDHANITNDEDKQKSVDELESISQWHAIHVVEVTTKSQSQSLSNYKLTSTVILGLFTSLQLMGSLTRQQEQDYKVVNWDDHVVNIGRMVEDMEIRMRHALNVVYFEKTKDLSLSLRSDSLLGGELNGVKEELRREMFKN